MEKSTLSRPIATSEISGAVFWTVLFGIVMVVDVLDDIIPSGSKMYSSDALLAMFAAIVFAMAYFSQKGRKWGFIVSMLVSAFFVIATLATDGLEKPDAYTGSLLVFVGLFTLYANYLGFLKARAI